MVSGEEAFTFGMEASKMYFVVSGSCDYFAGRGITKSATDHVVSGTWLCEMVLWMCWHHRGRLEATEGCDCVLIDTDRLRQVVQLRPVVLRDFRSYATKYAAEMQAHEPRQVTDLFGGFERVQELVQNVFEDGHGVLARSHTETSISSGLAHFKHVLVKKLTRLL